MGFSSIERKVVFYFFITIAIMTKVEAVQSSISLSDEKGGTIPECQISTPDGGEYSYSRMAANIIKKDEGTQLPSMTKTWMVSCNVDTRVFLKVNGLQEDRSIDGITKFSLGRVNGDGVIGYYNLKLARATIDGVPAMFSQSGSVNGNVSFKNVEMKVSSDSFYGLEAGDGKKNSGRTFTIDVTILPFLSGLKETKGPMVDGAFIDGQSDFVFYFGF
ncbi:hypothetical protein [Serratia marcescens]|uniref:hypothetical protein n=1 Tax=Serratia marcescens TaxID=615 RepID=UPI0011C12AD9|nr:hypothetical protein [Serratia marcescens]